jgi:hypothetical protein
MLPRAPLKVLERWMLAVVQYMVLSSGAAKVGNLRQRTWRIQ